MKDFAEPCRSGTRDELVKVLRNMAGGCLAGPLLASEAAEGADRLEAGDSSVQVGYTVYEATDVP